MKYYKINENTLLNFLENTLKLNCLYDNGVDNWLGYMDNEEGFIADALETTEEEVREKDLNFQDVAKKYIKTYELLEEKGE